MNYLLTSTFIHAAILLSLCLSPDPTTTQGRENIEVNIRNSFKKVEQPPILQKSQTLPKYAKLGQGPSKQEKEQQIDMSQYANQLKAVVDPVWYSHVHGLEDRLNRKLTTIVLLFPDKHGNIKSIRIVKGSGSSDLDALAIQTFREVGTIPNPPDSLVKEGIEWEFSIGGRSQ